MITVLKEMQDEHPIFALKTESRLLNPEEPARSFGGGNAQLFKRAASDLRRCLSDLPDVGGLTPFPSIRHRCKKWRVRFQHEVPEWCRRKRVADFLSVLESQYACKADDRPKCHDAPHRSCVIREAMKYGAYASGKGFELRDRVLKRFPLVDHAIKPGFGCHL